MTPDQTIHMIQPIAVVRPRPQRSISVTSIQSTTSETSEMGIPHHRQQQQQQNGYSHYNNNINNTRRENGHDHTKNSKQQPVKPPEIILSRTTYAAGEPLLGLIHIYNNNNSTPPPSSSATLIITGKCRLDPRWHNTKAISDLYGSHPLLPPHLAEKENNTVCFYATAPVDLHTTPVLTEAFSLSETTNAVQEGGGREDRRSFLFRVDLPNNLPPSMRGISCRYYYTVSLSSSTDPLSSSSSSSRPLVTNVFFCVVAAAAATTPPPSLSNDTRNNNNNTPTTTNTSVLIGHTTARSLPPHCTTLPINLPSTSRRYPPQRQLFVISPPTTTRRLRHPSSSPPRPLTTSLRVTNARSAICRLDYRHLELMSPGSSARLRFLFGSLTNCLGVAISLEGVEYALHRKMGGSGDGNGGDGEWRKKARTFVFDSKEMSMSGGDDDDGDGGGDNGGGGGGVYRLDEWEVSLQLPLDCPTTVLTDLVEIRVFCRVVLTVEGRGVGKGGDGADDDDDDDGPEEEVLRLEIPVTVVRDDFETFDDDDEEEEEEEYGDEWHDREEEEEGERMILSDVRKDLKKLSLSMIQHHNDF